jgi:hypothetical protein
MRQIWKELELQGFPAYNDTKQWVPPKAWPLERPIAHTSHTSCIPGSTHPPDLTFTELSSTHEIMTWWTHWCEGQPAEQTFPSWGTTVSLWNSSQTSGFGVWSVSGQCSRNHTGEAIQGWIKLALFVIRMLPFTITSKCRTKDLNYHTIFLSQLALRHLNKT